MDVHRLYPSKYIKYLGLYIDEFLNWNFQISQINSKLIRANSMLKNIRHYVSKKVLLTIYHSTFSSHLNSGIQVWGQNIAENSQTFILQKNAMRIISFSTD